MKAHPTTYGGVNFRSRLEAKWAAFFDLLGWRWQYEPIDLDGWTPDFSLQGVCGPIYVEVKPICWFGGADMNMRQARRKDLLKILGHEDDAPEVLVLGNGPAALTNTIYDASSGSFLLGALVASSGKVDMACIGKNMYCEFDFYALNGDQYFEIDPIYAYKHSFLLVEIQERWNKACNRVQWRAPMAA